MGVVNLCLIKIAFNLDLQQITAGVTSIDIYLNISDRNTKPNEDDEGRVCNVRLVSWFREVVNNIAYAISNRGIDSTAAGKTASLMIIGADVRAAVLFGVSASFCGAPATDSLLTDSV
uniref:Uncharacterized protein n=1 Tax=Plectus sambesii TaxID=2011161 RepID=A0A914WS03_9BILA